MSLPVLLTTAGADTPTGVPASGVPARPLWGDLSVAITRPDGPPIRWGGDELDAANVPCDLSFATSMPGGFKACTCTLFRALDLPGREGLFDDVTILGPGQEIVWEGRLQQMPASSDSGGRVNPQAVGHSAHLEDDQTFREIYCDRELSGWQGRPAGRRQDIMGASWSPRDGSTRWDNSAATSAGPVLDLSVGVAKWDTAGARPHVGMVYDGGGIPLAQCEWRWRGSNVSNSTWSVGVATYSDSGCRTSTHTATVGGASVTNDQLYQYVPSAPGAAIEPTVYAVGAPAGDGSTTYTLLLAEVAVYGAHGVPSSRSTSYTGTVTGPWAFRASDVLPDVLSRAAPQLRWTTGEDGTIEPTDFAIRHLTFREPTTAAACVQELNKYHLWDWAVWENRTFYFRRRGQGRTWKIATGDGLDLSLEGDTTDQIYNGVVVTWTDYAGQTHTSGPPGSTAEYIDPRLVSHDETNPATVHGVRRWYPLTLSTSSDPESAATIGQGWLGGAATATRRGSATVYGTVYDDAGNPHPAWRVRAGDMLVVTDRPDDPPRRIIETQYTHAARSNQLTLDSTAATVEAWMERIQGSLIGVL